MARTNKQTLLDRCRAIALATVDYIEAHPKSQFICDGVDPEITWRAAQRERIQKQYGQRHLDRMQKDLEYNIRFLQHHNDFDYEVYIKEKTGYEIELFAGLGEKVNRIVATGIIRDNDEFQTVNAWLKNPEINSLLKKTLSGLTRQYGEKLAQQQGKTMHHFSSETYDAVNGKTIRHVTAMSGPKPKHFQETIILGPEPQRYLIVTKIAHSNDASTSVALALPKGTGRIFSIDGVQEITASWKNNDHIFIQFPKGLRIRIQHREIRSFDDNVNIEYKEQ
jgi:hypothetical protein